MSFTYTVRAPETLGPYSFDGELVDFEKDTYPVGGVSSVTVAELPPTALRTISETAVVEGDQFDVTVIAFNYGLAGTLVESLGAGLEYVSSNMADALIVNGQTLTYTLVGNNLSVTYTVEATQTGTHVISGYLQSFDRSIAPVQVSGANSVTVSSATQPPTDGGTYVGPDPTATPVPTETPVPPTATRSAADRDIRAANSDISAADRDIRAADRDIRAANRDIRAADRDIRAANRDIRAADRDISAANRDIRAADRNGYVSAANRDISAANSRQTATAHPCRRPRHQCRQPRHQCRQPRHQCRRPRHQCRQPRHQCRRPRHPCRQPRHPCRRQQRQCRRHRHRSRPRQ